MPPSATVGSDFAAAFGAGFCVFGFVVMFIRFGVLYSRPARQVRDIPAVTWRPAPRIYIPKVGGLRCRGLVTVVNTDSTSALGTPKVCLLSCLAILFIPLFYFFQPFLQRHHAKENVGVGVWTTRGVPALVLIQVLNDPPKMVARGLIHNSFPFIAASPGRLASGKRHGGGCISYRGMRYL
jgi:hypothetical protein